MGLDKEGILVNIRQKCILKMLLSDSEITLQEVSEMFSVSSRTIRYDIQMINEYFRERVNTEGIALVNNLISFHDIDFRNKVSNFITLDIADFYAQRLTSEERILFILFDLCWGEGFMNIQTFMDKYFVSRATINNDLIAIREYCENESIQLVSKRGKGIYIEADEKERRKHLAKILRDFTSLTGIDNEFVSELYTSWFDKDVLERIRRIVKEVEESFKTYLMDVAYEALVIHIALSIQRFEKNPDYSVIEGISDFEEESLQYKMALEMINRINNEFEIELPEAEVCYIAIHVGAKSSGIMYKDGDAFLEYYCIRMIGNVSKLIKMNLTEDDKLFFSLLQHLSACKYRKKMGMSLDNPLKEDLLLKYPDLYEIIKAVIQDCEEPDVVIASDDEIAYILLHFVAAIERNSGKSPNIARVIVVCATGIGTAELVASRLEDLFTLDICGMISRHQLDYFLQKEQVDLIISTVPINSEIPTVNVHPFLTDKDCEEINMKLFELGYSMTKQKTRFKNVSALAKQIGELSQNYPEQKDEKKLLEELRKLLFKGREVKEEVCMLSELLNENSIELGVHCSDWGDAIRKSGNILIRNDSITEDYIEAVIKNVKELGPYIVITKGVALPHASNKDGVKETSMSLIILDEAVPFGNPSNDPVKYVFMLATKDANSHLGALADLAEFLERPEFIKVLEEAKSVDAIVSYIKSHETSI